MYVPVGLGGRQILLGNCAFQLGLTVFQLGPDGGQMLEDLLLAGGLTAQVEGSVLGALEDGWVGGNGFV